MIKKIALVFVCFFPLAHVNAQLTMAKETAHIVKEGKLLYHSEMASWHGTDIFVEKFKDKTANIGGYFSYLDNDSYKCLFFSKGENPKVIGSVTFDKTYTLDKAVSEAQERDFTDEERTYYEIRKLALKQINTDTLYKKYNNTSLNLIPIINEEEKKVYVLTGPKNHGTVIIGNDYLLTFDKENELVEQKRLHKNIIPLNYAEQGKTTTTVHSHLPETGYFITPTDICTLMLYGKFANWKQHYVISAKYICIWDFEKNDLLTLTKEAWERIAKDQKERKKN